MDVREGTWLRLAILRVRPSPLTLERDVRFHDATESLTFGDVATDPETTDPAAVTAVPGRDVPLPIADVRPWASISLRSSLILEDMALGASDLLEGGTGNPPPSLPVGDVDGDMVEDFEGGGAWSSMT